MENSVENNRSSNYELLRIFAMLMIVACHYSCHGIRHCLNPEMCNIWQNGITANKFFTSFLINGGGIGNGIFFMLTGFFMYDKEYEIRRILKLLAQVYFYSFFMLFAWALIRFFHVYNFPELSKTSQVMLIINAIIPITSGAWWFIQTYCVLFLFIPVLNNLLEKLKSKGLIIILCFVWIFWFAPKIFGFGYSNFQMAVFFYILGAVLKKNNFTLNKWLSGMFFCMVWFFLTFIDMKNSQIIKSENISDMILKVIYSGISTAMLTPLAVIFLFEFCKGIKIRNSKIINTIAASTFGVYLIHDSSVGRQFIWNKVFHCLDYQYNSKYFPILAIATVLIVFVSCSIIDLLRKLLLERKTIHILNTLIDKIDIIQKNELN